jgi:hypothetical protein
MNYYSGKTWRAQPGSVAGGRTPQIGLTKRPFVQAIGCFRAVAVHGAALAGVFASRVR